MAPWLVVERGEGSRGDWGAAEWGIEDRKKVNGARAGPGWLATRPAPGGGRLGAAYWPARRRRAASRQWLGAAG